MVMGDFFHLLGKTTIPLLKKFGSFHNCKNSIAESFEQLLQPEVEVQAILHAYTCSLDHWDKTPACTHILHALISSLVCL